MNISTVNKENSMHQKLGTVLHDRLYLLPVLLNFRITSSIVFLFNSLLIILFFYKIMDEKDTLRIFCTKIHKTT